MEQRLSLERPRSEPIRMPRVTRLPIDPMVKAIRLIYATRC